MRRALTIACQTPMPAPTTLDLLAAAVRVAARRPAQQPVLGVPLALTDYERTLDWIDATVDARATAATSASRPCTR